MKSEALLLTGGGLSVAGSNVAKVLHFFGIPQRAVTVTEFLGHAGHNHESSAKCRALCSSDTFIELIRELEDNSEAIQVWRKRVHSVFVYAGDIPAVLQEVMQRLTGDEGVVFNQMNHCGGGFVVSEELDDFCRVMSGVRVSASKADCRCQPRSEHGKGKCHQYHLERSWRDVFET